ncbi:MAG: A24 family peptidase [Pseudomonadota bacterium]|nr:A24 family peptidase [Pseudomonadota bacterium]
MPQDLVDFLQNHHLAFLLWVGCIGLMIGSFLNVVIYRVPIMLQQQWNSEQSTLNLFKPRSFCPHCQTMIPARHNLPIFSFILLRGQSHCCNKSIAIRYPLIEIMTFMLSIFIANHFGVSTQTLAALIFIWTLLALSVIDLDHQILPDNITLPLIWAGLLLNIFQVFVAPTDAIIGATVGYCVFWSIATVFKKIRGIDGMGLGDAKLLAAMGAWLGWQSLPLIILLAATGGAIIGISYNFITQRGQHEPIPFGPFIAGASIVTMLWGQPLTAWYLQWH